MKILFISDGLRRGGKERQLAELIKQLTTKEICVTLILFDKNIGYPEIERLNINIEILNKKGLKAAISIFKMYQIVKKLSPDVIHSWSPLTTILVSPAAKFFMVPMIDSIRYAKTVKPLSKTWIVSKLSFFLSSMVIANSIAGLKTHHKQKDSKYRVIYNGFDINRNKAFKTFNQIKSELSISQSKIVGMVANFYQGKDYYTFVSGAEQLLSRNRDIAFVCIGDGPTLQHIESGIKVEHRNNFYFLGRRDDVEEIVKLFDIGVLLSNTNFSAEGISNALIEIMSASVPVIATNAGGNPELIENEKEGYLIEAFDKKAFVEKADLLIKDKNLQSKTGNLAREKILNHFSIETMANNYLNTYQQLAK